MYAGGTPRPWCVRRFKVKTATGLKLGKFVIRDTDDDHVQLAGAGAKNVLGVYIRNITQPDLGADSAPTTEDEVEVALVRSGAIVKAFIATANMLDGARINTDANGDGVTAAEAAAGDMHKVCAVKMGDTDGTTPTRGLVIL